MALAEQEVQGRLPVDRFGVRLAILRADLGIGNVAKAARTCGLSDESWRQWEAGSSPQNLEKVCRKIADATGYSFEWLMLGGPLVKIAHSFFDALSSPCDQQVLLDETCQPLDFAYPILASVTDLASRRAS